MTAPTPLEVFIMERARASDCMAEVCNLIEYDPDIGRVPEHWRVKGYLMPIFEAVAALPP